VANQSVSFADEEANNTCYQLDAILHRYHHGSFTAIFFLTPLPAFREGSYYNLIPYGKGVIDKTSPHIPIQLA
jgi:hypothetical protein